MKIAVIGAGPAGLTFARLMKRKRPDASIVVYEQNPRAATYGFGVGLSGGLRSMLSTYDAEVHQMIQEASIFDSRQIISVNGHGMDVRYSDAGGAIRRLDLLNVLQNACEAVGVEVAYDVRISDLEAFDGDDLIVGADGVNSVVRAQFTEQFGTRINQLKNHHAWYGVESALIPSGLSFKGSGDAAFVGHFYAYTPTLSTFVAECNEAAWQEAGMEEMSNAERKAYFEEMYRDELQGYTLVDNKSHWRCFPVVTNERWIHENKVLLGDALRSAHFSIGSGTRLAMEDAFALFDALVTSDYDIARGLALFVEKRYPSRQIFGSAAEMSFNWYEDMAQKMREPLPEFVYSFLTRTGRVDDDRLNSYCPGFAEEYRTYLQSKHA